MRGSARTVPAIGHPATSPARMASRALAALLTVLSFCVASVGLAQTPAAPSEPTTDASAPNPDQGTPFGVVFRASGDINATRPQDQHGRVLHAGDTVYVGDVIRSGSQGEAVVKTDDAGMIGIRSNTEFLAERYSAKARDSDRMTLRIIQGSLRIISGWIGRVHRDNYAIRTPTATIGVRGTDHEPYVLSPERATGTPYQAGAYDKVNSGRTVMTTSRGDLEIDAGHVGFARGSGSGSAHTRGILTLLLPVLLDRIPDFYLGGQFENELDAYAKSADQQSAEKLKQLQGGGPVSSTAPAVASCSARAVAKEWLARFDKGITDHDVDAIVNLFAEDASIEAIVHSKDGEITSLTLSRQEFATSATDAVHDLTKFSQKRSTLDVSELSGNAEGSCPRVYIKSEVLEQGKQNGRAYRFESREEFVLDQRDGVWRAIHAIATQH